MGIDDPVSWFNAVPESVLDGWYAFYLFENEQKNGSVNNRAMMSPQDALKQFSGMFG